MIDFEIKEWFFDRGKVVALIGKQRAKFLRNVGGYIQRTARNSMPRKGKARKPPKNQRVKAYLRWLAEIKNQPSSPPGKPPFVHSDDPVRTLKNILYGFTMTQESILVGIVGLRHKYRRSQGGSLPPELHEHGGTARIPEKQVVFPNGGRKWVPRGSRVRVNQRTRNRMAKYPPRPIIAPAVTKTASLSKFKDLWFSGGRRAG